MRLRRMMSYWKHRWKVLKLAFLLVIVFHVYLFYIRNPEPVKMEPNSGKHTKSSSRQVESSRQRDRHPFAHLLPSQGDSSQKKKCTQPKLSLKHDALAFAFSPVDPLVCEGARFFHLEEGMLHMNSSDFGGRELKKCEIFIISRETDDLSDMEPVTETSDDDDPIQVDEDFVYVRCFFQGEDKQNKEQGYVDYYGENVEIDDNNEVLDDNNEVVDENNDEADENNDEADENNEVVNDNKAVVDDNGQTVDDKNEGHFTGSEDEAEQNMPYVINSTKNKDEAKQSESTILSKNLQHYSKDGNQSATRKQTLMSSSSNRKLLAVHEASRMSNKIVDDKVLQKRINRHLLAALKINNAHKAGILNTDKVNTFHHAGKVKTGNFNSAENVKTKNFKNTGNVNTENYHARNVNIKNFESKNVQNFESVYNTRNAHNTENYRPKKLNATGLKNSPGWNGNQQAGTKHSQQKNGDILASQIDPIEHPPIAPAVDPPMKPPIEPPVDPQMEPPIEPAVDPQMEPPVDSPMKPPKHSPVSPPMDLRDEPRGNTPLEPPMKPNDLHIAHPPIGQPVYPDKDSGDEPPKEPPAGSPVEPPKDPREHPGDEPPKDPREHPGDELPKDPREHPEDEPPKDPPADSPLEPPLDQADDSERDPPIEPPDYLSTDTPMYPDAYDMDEMSNNPFQIYDPLTCDEEQLLVQVSPRRSVFERHKKAKKVEHASGLNVLMFGIDSMSHMNVKRKLPLTYTFLKESLNAVIFEGYNIVGDGTTQAILPIFVGKLQQEIPDILERPLDDLDFVWKKYKDQGYATVFAEDQPHLGVFNLRLKGFEEMPTDHYMRHFWQQVAFFNTDKDCGKKYCSGSTPNHQFLLRYLEDFFYKYRNISRFAVGFSGELSHDNINPSGYLDKDLRDFVLKLQTAGHLKNTVLIIFSDHGSRMGKLRRTLQGKLEERLPFLSVVLPKSFKSQHKKLYANLVQNAKGLTSPFDVHETLHDLLNLSRAYKPSRKGRGVSLFQSIPVDRTCVQAGIDTHWCTCVHEKPVPRSEPVVQGVAQTVLSAINNLTQANRKLCAPLRLKKVQAASLVVPDLELLKFHRTEETGKFIVSYGNITSDMAEFQITIETDKCGGVFEATVQARYRLQDQESQDDMSEKETLTYHVDEADISRIDRYGTQPACIAQSNPQIMKFCCCKGYLHGKNLNSS